MIRTIVAMLCLAPLAASAQDTVPAAPTTAWVAPAQTHDEHFAKRQRAALDFPPLAERSSDPAIVNLLTQQQTSMLQMQQIQVQILLLLQDMRGEIKASARPAAEKPQ
jgi:hypothetical protein